MRSAAWVFASNSAARRAVCVGLVALSLAGCGRRPAPPQTSRARLEPVVLAVHVFADSGHTYALPTAPRESLEAHGVGLVIVGVAPARAGLSELPVPTPEAAPPPAGTEAEIVPAPDDALKPPIARTAARLRLPRGVPRRGWVELDVRVDEAGRVSDALVAASDADSAAVALAIESALDLRFYPALQSGRPVAVWCRQRFEFATPRR